MSQNPAVTQRSSKSSVSNAAVSLPLDNILRHLALEPIIGQQFAPSAWTSLRIRSPLEASTQVSQLLNVQYRLQHNAFAVFDNTSKKWRIQGEGDSTALKTLGVIASKKHGARVIQLPNHTHKIVAGIINAETLLNLFSSPALSTDGTKVVLTAQQNVQLPFTAVSPQQYKPKSSASKVTAKSQYQHLEYTLHSSKEETHEQSRTDFAWTESPHKTLSVVNGTDIQDLAHYKNILTSLRSDFLEDQHAVEGGNYKREVLEKRLLLLEHEIDGLLKRKINYTSKDAAGTRFLDYTTILNDKENEIVTLSKKIQNLETRLKERKSEESHLKGEIERLNTVITTLNNPQVTREDIDNLLLSQFQTINIHKQTQKLKSKTTASHHILKSHLKDLELKGVKVDNHEQLNAIVDESKDIDVNVSNGIVHIIQTRDKLIEVPIQDLKTRQLIKQMGIELYRIYSRYPKVKEEADVQLIELLNKEVINVVDADGLSKITEIIKYVPSLVKVENIYSFNNDRQRKIEFHLRVLLKALLTEFQRMKDVSGVTPEIDQSVVTMIHEEIGDASIDDILKVFQLNHKIVEVPKIVEKIVERIIEVPTIIPVERIVEKIVENVRIEEVEKIIHVPIEVIKYVDKIIEKIVEVVQIREKIVEVPRIIEKIVEKRVEVPKIVEVQVIREKIVEVEKPVIIQRVVNQVIPEIREVEVIRQETVVVKEVQEKIKEVERIVEKIVERIVEKPVIIEVEKIIEKIVHSVNYKPAREVVNHIEHVPQIVERVVQKVIPIIQIVERIKEVPKIIEKIVEVRVQVPTVKEIKVIQEKIVYRDRVKEIEITIEKIVPLIKQVIKQVERRVEIPIIQEKIVKVIEYIEKVVPEKYEIVKIVQIEKEVEKIVEVIKMIEVQKPIFKYITVEKPVKVIVQTIVEVPRIIERIKEVRVPIDKIIEKLVEVPKVVEVEKIVEKIVVVPRIVEKIVEVPQIVERIVDRIVEIEKIKEVIREVRIPIIQERIIEIQIIKNIEVPVIKEVIVYRDKIVTAIQEKEVIKTVDVIKEKIVEARVEIPKQIIQDRIVPHTVEIEKIVQVEKAIVIPFELPVPCDKIIEKLVLVEKEVERIVHVQTEVEKIVEVIKEVPTVKEVTKIEQRPIIHQVIKEIEKIVPYITEKITEVEVIREKPVLTPQIEERIKQVAAIHEKIVQVVHEVPKIYEIQKVVQKIVEVPRFIEITAKEPVIITNNKIVDQYIDRVVQVTLIQQQIVAVPTIEEKIITVQKIVQEIREIYLNNDKIVEHERLVSKTDVNNKIQTKYETVDRIEEKLVPVTNSYEKIVQVPHLMEKIVERIVLMPQIHQVTQHIIDVQEEGNPGVAVDIEFSEHQAQYNKLYGNLKKDTDALIIELRAMKKANPQLKDNLEQIEGYILQLDEITAFPKIVQVTKDKFVNRDVPVPVLLSKKTSENIKTEAFYLVLIEKLTKELKKAKGTASYVIEDEQLKLFFLNSVNKDDDRKLKDKIQAFKHSKEGEKYSNVSESMLSEVLYDKFYLANILEKSKLQSQRYRRISDERLELLHRFKQTNDVLHQRLLDVDETIRSLIKKDGSSLNKETLEKIKGIELQIEQLDQLLYTDIKNNKINEPIQSVSKQQGNDINYRLQESRIRELEAEIELLRREYLDKAGSIISQQDNSDKDRVIDSLRKTIIHLADNKGTKTTLGGDDERRDTITSLQKLGDTKGAKKTLNNETSIIGFMSGSPVKSLRNDWDEFPIIKEEDHDSHNENFGYIILPHGKTENDAKSYKVIENKQKDSYIILPIGDHNGGRQVSEKSEQELLRIEREMHAKAQLALKGGKKPVKIEQDTQNYPYGNEWLPYGDNNIEHSSETVIRHVITQVDSHNVQGQKTSNETIDPKGSQAHKQIGGEWIDPKNAQFILDQESSSSNNAQILKRVDGEWVETKNTKQKVATGEWIDPKSNSRVGAGQWVSPKKAQISTLNIEPSSISQGHNIQTYHPTINVQQHYTVIEPNTMSHELVPSGPTVNFNYQQPGALIIPNFFNPNNIPSLPGNASRITYIDEHGNPVDSFNQAGQIEGDAGNGASYSATYVYKSETKEEGEGLHKIQKKITEIRTNQTVNWISRSRVIDTEHEQSPRKDNQSPHKDSSPPKDFIVTPKK